MTLVFTTSIGLNDVTKILGSLLTVCDKEFRDLPEPMQASALVSLYSELKGQYAAESKEFTFAALLETVTSIKGRSFGAYIIQLCDPVKLLGSIGPFLPSVGVEQAYCLLGISDGHWKVGHRDDEYLFTKTEIEGLVASNLTNGPQKPCFEIGTYVLYNLKQYLIVAEDASTYRLSNSSEEITIQKNDANLVTNYETAASAQEIDNRASESQKYKNVTFNGTKYGPRPHFVAQLDDLNAFQETFLRPWA